MLLGPQADTQRFPPKLCVLQRAGLLYLLSAVKTEFLENCFDLIAGEV